MTSNSAKYRAKAEGSFRTKLNLYLFDKATNGVIVEVTQTDFDQFRLTDELVDAYTTVYWQQLAEHEIKGRTMGSIESSIAKWMDGNKALIDELKNNYVSQTFPKLFPASDFDKLLEQTSCEYCKVTISQIERLADRGQIRKKNLRGWTLEIDRLNSNLEYTRDNCVMACYWCNNAKTDEFNAEEFKPIGEAIARVWEQRMASAT